MNNFLFAYYRTSRPVLSYALICLINQYALWGCDWEVNASRCCTCDVDTAVYAHRITVELDYPLDTDGYILHRRALQYSCKAIASRAHCKSANPTAIRKLILIISTTKDITGKVRIVDLRG